VEAMAEGVEQVAALADPIGLVTERWTRPNGLIIERVRTPLGVIGVIYESRPNVTADAGALCLKAGDAVILRGGAGQDSLLGGGGDDLLLGGAGNDTIDGGDGVDTVSYEDAVNSIGVGVYLWRPSNHSQGDGGVDQLTNIENVTGSTVSDTLEGNSGDNVLRGLGGNDALVGHDGNDTLIGDDGEDFLRGRSGDDVLQGGASNDFLSGGEGNDTFDGGDGFDRASMFLIATDPQTGATVDLAVAGPQVDIPLMMVEIRLMGGSLPANLLCEFQPRPAELACPVGAASGSGPDLSDSHDHPVCVCAVFTCLLNLLRSPLPGSQDAAVVSIDEEEDTYIEAEGTDW